MRRKEQTGKSLIDILLKKFKWEENLTSIKVTEIWNNLMGENIAQRTKKIESENKILKIYLSSSILRNELNMNRYQILSAIHKELGEEYFDGIKFL